MILSPCVFKHTWAFSHLANVRGQSETVCTVAGRLLQTTAWRPWSSSYQASSPPRLQRKHGAYSITVSQQMYRWHTWHAIGLWLVECAPITCQSRSEMSTVHEKQDAQLSQRDRAAGCIIVLAKSGKLELGDNILQTQCDKICLKMCWIRWKKCKIRPIVAFKVIEVGTDRKPICDFLLVINSNWHPGIVLELSQLIVQISDTLRFWATLWGLRSNIWCSSYAHDTLVGNLRRKLARVIRRWKFANVTCFPALVFISRGNLAWYSAMLYAMLESGINGELWLVSFVDLLVCKYML